MKPKASAIKEQRLNAELGLIADEMGHAMMAADKEYIANSLGHASAMGVCFTLSMQTALAKFKEFCERNYGK